MRLVTLLQFDADVRHLGVRHRSLTGAGSPRRQRVMLPSPRVLVIEKGQDGILLNRFSAAGEFAGDTCHRRLEDAKRQATFEFGDLLGRWVPLSDADADPIRFALEVADEAPAC